jgi:hypothetical protein
MRTCVCGNQVANNAKACPQCGHRFTSAIAKVFVGFVVVCMCFGIIVSIVNKPTQSEPAPSAAEEAKFQLAVAGAKQLRDSMRNPDSFKLGQTLIMSDGSVCYDFRAQNGFGGMNVDHAVVTPSGQFKSSESSGFTALWKKECAGKTGVDKTWEVGYAAGFHGISDK